MAPHWYEFVRQLQSSPGSGHENSRKRLDQKGVSDVLTEAVAVARKDSDWNSSGLPESLQRALDLCDKQGPAVAIAAALRLLDFQHIVEAKSSNSPKGSPKQGAALTSMTELHVPVVETQLSDSLSRTSVPVITIKRSSESRSIPTTTTIVLQPSSVQSNFAQRDERQSASSHSEASFGARRLAPTDGQMDCTKLYVLKSKNGRSNGYSSTPLSKSPPSIAAVAHQPSHIVREVQNGQRPKPTPEDGSHPNSGIPEGPHSRAAPPRAASPPASHPASNTVSSGFVGREQPKQMQVGSNPQANPSPFQASEAQSHSQESSESRHSNSDSDKSVQSAGATKRSRPQTSGADSPPNAESALSKRQKGPASHRGQSGLERLVSLGTVLQCVDTRNDREGSFDSAVGQRPATVHEVTAGSQSRAALDSQASQGEEGRRASSGANGASLTSNGASPHANGAVEEKPATVSITLSADSARRLKAQAAESGLHQSDSGLARVLGDNPQIIASVIGPPISGQLGPLTFPPLPLSSPPPLVQLPMHIPPLKLEPLPGIGQNKLDLRQIEGGSLQTALSAETDQGSLQTSLWSGKVKHKLGQSTVDLFYMTALIPEKYLEQFPPTLFVTSLATQKDVKLGRHYVMRCRLDFLTEKQLGKLQMLAQGKVVAICRLQHCTVTLVPYYDKHQALRVVGFMLSDD